MLGKIIKIDPLKESRTEKAFRRVYFTLEDGSWAKTDIVPDYRNYRRWRSLIELFDNGAIIFVEGIQLRNKAEVDADSPVEYSFKRFEITKAKEKKFIQEGLL